MVEATIIFPIVLLTVMAMLYLGLFKLQESAMLYQVQRAATAGSMMVASPGYASLAEKGSALDAKAIDWKETPTNIEEYYKAYHSGFKTLYRELFGCSGWIGEGDVANLGDRIRDTISILAAGRLFRTEVDFKRNFFGYTVTASVSYELETPAVLKYFQAPDRIVWKQSAYQKAINPASFIRNTDLAADAVVVICEKLGLGGQLDKLKSGFDKVTDFLF